MNEITLRACAKLNLTLDVLQKRPDGYHDIRSVMQAIDLCDEVTVAVGGDLWECSCDCAEVPDGESNLAMRAARAFFAAAGLREQGVSIRIEKRIPSQAGLGGGSADAAAVLRALHEMNGFRVPETELLKIGLKIGADVPFCMTGGTRLCLNKGEIMADLPAFRSDVLIAKPDAGVSTAEAYRRVDAAPALTHPQNDRVLFHFARGEYKAGLDHAGNLFEQLVPLPEGETIKRILRIGGAYYAAMSGSGAAFFGLFDKAGAAAAKEALAAAGCFVCLCATAQKGVEAQG